MKTIFITVVLVSILFGASINAQTVPDSTYYKRLYFTCKTWGFIKYFIRNNRTVEPTGIEIIFKAIWNI